MEKRGGGRKQKGKRTNNPCQLKPYFVNFSHIGWDQWVVGAGKGGTSKGYNMNICEGSCRYTPIPSHLEPTNHAVFQQMYHSKGSDVRPACCVPIEYKPLTILFNAPNSICNSKSDLIPNMLNTEQQYLPSQSDEEKVTCLKNFPDMIITKCGCR